MTVLFACLTLALSIGLAACTNFSSQSPCHKGWACWGVTRYWAHICKCDDHWACTDSQHLTNHYANCDQFQYSTTKKCHKGLGWAGCGTEQVPCKIHKAGHPHTGCQNNEDEETPHRYRYKAWNALPSLTVRPAKQCYLAADAFMIAEVGRKVWGCQVGMGDCCNISHSCMISHQTFGLLCRSRGAEVDKTWSSRNPWRTFGLGNCNKWWDLRLRKMRSCCQISWWNLRMILWRLWWYVGGWARG